MTVRTLHLFGSSLALHETLRVGMWIAESPARNKVNFVEIGLSPKATHRADSKPKACRLSDRAAIPARGPRIGWACATIWLSTTQTTEADRTAINPRLTRRAVRLGRRHRDDELGVGQYISGPFQIP